MVLGKYRQAIEENSTVRWEETSDYPAGRLTGEVSVAPVVDDKGVCTHLVGSVHDITERKRTDEQLRLSEEQYSSLFSEMLSGCSIQEIICDEQGSPIDYITLNVNKSFERILKVRRENVVGKRASEILPLEELNKWLEIFGDVAITGTPKHYEQFSPSNNRFFEGVVFSPKLGQFAVTFEDITERKRAEDALRERDENLRMAQRLANIGSWTWITATDAVQWSEELCHINGYDPKLPAPGLAEMSSFYTPESWKRLAEAVTTALQSGDSYELELDIVRTDGIIRNTFTRGAVDYDANGRIVGLHGTVQDITDRKRAEVALRESEEKYRLLAESSSDYIFTIDRDLVITYVNGPGAREWGLSPADMTGRYMRDLFPPDIYAQQSSYVKTVFDTGEPIYSEHLSAFPKSGPKWLDSWLVPIKGKDGKTESVMGISRNITERKQAEKALRESEERLRDITLSMGDWVWEVDENGVYTYSSEKGLELFGPTRENVIGKTPFDFMPPDEAKRVAAIFSEIVANKAPINDLENWNIGKNGKKICLLTNGVPILDAEGNLKGYRGVDKDITDRKLAEVELLKFKLGLELSGEAIFLTDVEGRILYVNPAFEKTYGYSAGEALGNTPRILKSGTLSNEVYKNFWGALLSKQVVSGEMTNKTKDGRILTIEGSANPVLDAHGDIIAFLAIQRDITHRKRAEEEAARLSQKNELILRSAGEGILGVDLQGCHTFVNPAAAWMLGYEAEELVGRPSHSTWHHTRQNGSPYPSEECHIYDTLRDGMVYRSSLEVFWRKDGTSFPVEYASKPIYERGRVVGAVVTFADITERKQAEEALRESEGLLRAITNTADVVIFLKGVDGRYLFVNRLFEKLFRVTDAAICGKTDFDVFPREVAEAFRRNDEVVVQSKQPLEVEERVPHDDGIHTYISVKFPIQKSSGEIFAVCGIATDITNRKQGEEKLRESEERFRVLIENQGEGVGIVDMNEVFQLANPAAERIFGVPTGGLVGRNLSEFVPSEDLQVIRGRTKERQSGSGTTYELNIERPNGTRCCLLVTATPQYSADGTLSGTLGVFRDITDMKRAEEALRESEQSYHNQFANNSAVMLLIDPKDGAIIDANAAALDFYGYSRERMLAMCITDINTLPDSEVRQAMVSIPPERGKRFEFHHRLADGSVRDVEVMASSIQFGGRTILHSIIHDITDRKRAEEALRESEERFRQSMDNMLEGCMIIGFDWRYLYVNDAAARHGHSNRNELVGRSMLEMYQGIEQSEIFAHYRHCMEERTPQRFESSFTFVDGSIEWFELSVRPSPEGIFVVSISITERKRMEEERLEFERRLLHGQKLESLGVLAGGIAHDFNNLLAAVIGNLSLAADDLPELPSVREAIEQATLAAERAADLTKQMLAYSGRGHFQLKELSLNKLVQENAQMLRAVIPKSVTLDLRLGEDLPPIVVDTSQLQQIAMNLITNASEAIEDQGGSITIFTGVDSCSETYLSRSRTEQKPEAGMFVWMEVRDTGCGMDDETQRRLFEPFFTTKFAGRGLGMAAVLGIVQGHGGALIIDSEAGKGTSMRVLFPAVQVTEDKISEDQQVTLAAKSDAVHVRLSGTVLVVDDEEMIRVLCEAILLRLGFRVLLAVDGEEAVRVFQAHAMEISAVILDLTMPLMDGATAFRKMLQINPDVKVILSSGYSEHDATKSFSGQHPAGFLQKPFHLKMLRAELERVLKTGETIGAPTS